MAFAGSLCGSDRATLHVVLSAGNYLEHSKVAKARQCSELWPFQPWLAIGFRSKGKLYSLSVMDTLAGSGNYRLRLVHPKLHGMTGKHETSKTAHAHRPSRERARVSRAAPRTSRSFSPRLSLGNIIGGVSLVASLGHAQVLGRERSPGTLEMTISSRAAHLGLRRVNF